MSLDVYQAGADAGSMTLGCARPRWYLRAMDRSRRRVLTEPDSPGALALAAAVVAVAYFAGARLGLRLAFGNENVTAVWPPTGIAVAGLVLLGRRVWPGVVVGAFLANLTNGASVPTSIGITVGNTLAPVLAASLLRVVDMRASLERVRDVIALAFAGGLVSMLVSATAGTTTLLATGALARGTYGSTWLVWWIGDSLGVVIFAPFILTFLSRDSELSLLRTRWRELSALLAGAAISSAILFGTHVPLPYLLMPFAIWAALRFYQAGAAALTVVVSVIAILQTVADNGPFSSLSRTTNLVSLQAFNATVALIALSLAALTRERARAQDALRAAAAELEDRVAARTAELVETTRRLQLIDEFKDSLLTSVSHELRTPLTVIMGATSALRSSELDLSEDQHAELLKRLESNALRLDSLLMDLLDIDRLNRRVIEPLPRPTELRATVLRVLELLAIESRSIDVDLDDTLASVDTAHLERIVENLLSNAVKHTPPDTPIWIRAEQSGEGVVLVVEDAGPGIPAELRTEIFEPFRRGDPRSHTPGTGVGLTLVARFATLNFGRAWVEERRGGGASFHVLLPRGSTH
jgi:signal transduction histidine kinase